MTTENKGYIIIYQNEDNKVSLNVRLEDENVWLTQQQYQVGAEIQKAS